MTTEEFTLALSSALRAHNLTHQFHDVLTAVVNIQKAGNKATIPGVCFALHCTYHNVLFHVARNPDFFEIDEKAKPRRFQLSKHGIEIMAKIKEAVERRAAALSQG